MIALTKERKQQIIEEEPGGLWLVLNEEEYPRDIATAVGLLGGNPDDPLTTQPWPLSLAVPADAFGATILD